MKRNLLLLFLTLTCNIIMGQTAYIQVIAEPNLSVYLNNQFKGKTTAELNGCIIENVKAGDNLIKIVKDGFTPFEESITIKPGEVFAYKVKPFTKHLVQISEQGNTSETKNKATIETGQLIIQSVPIEIKITIPEIEGINNITKTKDKWLADKIPAGSYKISFAFNQKVIDKTIDIRSNDSTSVFINMLNGDFKTKSSLDEKNKKEKVVNLRELIASDYIDSLGKVYKFKPGLTENEFKNYNTEAASIMTPRNFKDLNSKNGESHMYFTKNSGTGPKPFSVYIKDDKIHGYKYDVVGEKVKVPEMMDFYIKLVKQIEATIPKEFFEKSDASITIYYPKSNIGYSVQYSYWINSNNGSKFGTVSIEFSSRL